MPQSTDLNLQEIIDCAVQTRTGFLLREMEKQKAKYRRGRRNNRNRKR